jgi:hypothetical protein
MTRQHTRHCRYFGAAAIFVGMTTLGGCGSDASPTGNPAKGAGPSGPTASERYENKPPPPPRPETKEGCDACGGLWAVHGIEPAESCICRTSDLGKRCTDGRQCEGQCLVDNDAGFQVMDPSSPPRGFFTGTCSSYDTVFGCHFMIPPGVEDELPLPADEAAQHLCID